MNQDRPFNVLFVCSGSSARSIIAEAILNKLGAGHFVAYSAGSQPKDAVDPHALALLERLGYRTADLHPKSWHDFTGSEAPDFDLMFTLCDEVAGEAGPVLRPRPTGASPIPQRPGAPRPKSPLPLTTRIRGSTA